LFTDIWTAHLKTPEEKERFVNQLYSAKPVLDVLVRMIDEKVEALDKSLLSLKQYDDQNWPFRTAHKNGMASAYDAVKQLATIKD
jgi:hypothetical protein